MCEDDSFDDMVAYRLRREQLSRRGFGAVSLGAGLTSLLPVGCKSTDATPGPAGGGAAGGEVATTEAEVNITTPDGVCDAYFVHPASGAAPAVIVWPDIFGLRPAFRQMGKRLAGSGYAVLVVNPFYRIKKAPTSAPQANFEDKATREALMGMMGTLTQESETTDAKALTAWLDQQPSVDKGRKMGTAGYCMGGPIVFRTAAANPERIGAAATFHGGGLVSDKPDSPHLLIPRMKARFLIAIAGNDDAKQPDAKGTLKAAFGQASLPAKVEVYEAAKHGWCPPDSHVYDRDLAEKAWGEFVALLKESLGLGDARARGAGEGGGDHGGLSRRCLRPPCSPGAGCAGTTPRPMVRAAPSVGGPFMRGCARHAPGWPSARWRDEAPLEARLTGRDRPRRRPRRRPGARREPVVALVGGEGVVARLAARRGRAQPTRGVCLSTSRKARSGEGTRRWPG